MSILKDRSMKFLGDKRSEGARLDASIGGMKVEGSKIPGYAPQGMTSQLDKSVSTGPLRNSFNSDMTMGQRAMDAVGKGRLYAKHKYQDYQENENERTRDYSAAERIQGIAKSNPAALGKFAPALGAAIKRGGNSFAVTHFLLQQQDPEYRQMIKSVNEK